MGAGKCIVNNSLNWTDFFLFPFWHHTTVKTDEPFFFSFFFMFFFSSLVFFFVYFNAFCGHCDVT